MIAFKVIFFSFDSTFDPYSQSALSVRNYKSIIRFEESADHIVRQILHDLPKKLEADVGALPKAD